MTRLPGKTQYVACSWTLLRLNKAVAAARHTRAEWFVEVLGLRFQTQMERPAGWLLLPVGFHRTSGCLPEPYRRRDKPLRVFEAPLVIQQSLPDIQFDLLRRRTAISDCPNDPPRRRTSRWMVQSAYHIPVSHTPRRMLRRSDP